jgi:hypothetical protein
MWNVSARRFLLKAVFLFASLGLATAGHATSLTATFLGNVTSSELPSEFPTDAPAKFTVTYDSGLAATILDPNGIAIYSSPTSIWNIQIGSYVTSAVGGALVMHNNFLGHDVFDGSVFASPGNSFGTFAPGSAVNGVPLFGAQFLMTDSTGSLWNDLSLPTATFTGFDQTLLMLDFFVPGGPFGSDLQVKANIYRFTIEPTAVTETPLPAALPLFVTGLGVLGWAARRRNRGQLAGQTR